MRINIVHILTAQLQWRKRINLACNTLGSIFELIYFKLGIYERPHHTDKSSSDFQSSHTATLYRDASFIY